MGASRPLQHLWPGALSNTKRTLSQSITGKVLPDFRDKALMEPIQKKGYLCPGLLVEQRKTGSWRLIFCLQGSRVSSFIDKGSPNHKPPAFARNSRASLSFPFLNSGVHFSSLLINVLCGIFFPQNRALSSALTLKTCSSSYPFALMIFLMTSENSSAASY